MVHCRGLIARGRWSGNDICAGPRACSHPSQPLGAFNLLGEASTLLLLMSSGPTSGAPYLHPWPAASRGSSVRRTVPDDGPRK
eukprot:5904646-Alexandrium_andersonii.AAC.1